MIYYVLPLEPPTSPVNSPSKLDLLLFLYNLPDQSLLINY